MKKLLLPLLALVLLVGCSKELTVEEQFLVDCYEAQNKVTETIIEGTFLDVERPDIVYNDACIKVSAKIGAICEIMYNYEQSEENIEKFQECLLKKTDEEIKKIKES